jgi:hypothetical protein
MAIQHALEIAGVQFELLNNGVALVEGFRGITVDPRKIGLDDEIESR